MHALRFSWIVLLAASAGAAPLSVPNASFEEAGASPPGWTASGSGLTLDGGAAVATGSGTDSAHWLSEALPLKPGRTYELRFRARSREASGGTATSGPLFCNRDLGIPPERWTGFTSVFRVPDDTGPATARLRFGQWQVKGRVAFDEVGLRPVQAVYGAQGLGEGESLEGTHYAFLAPFYSVSRNDSRPLHRLRCGFNSNRWTLESGSEVVYRHRLPGRTLRAATVSVEVGWHTRGALVVEAGLDGVHWSLLATREGTGMARGTLPADGPPAEEIFVRLRPADPAAPASFQVHSYRFEAEVSGPAADLRGQTRYLALEEEPRSLEVQPLLLGHGQPGVPSEARLRVSNPGPQPLRVQPRSRVRRGDRTAEFEGLPVDVPAHGQAELGCPYTLFGTGSSTLGLSLESADGTYQASTELYVPEYYRADYGALLPGSSDRVGLWRASSGFKVAKARPVPSKRAESLDIRLARGEAEAAQLVVRPKERLQGFTAAAAALQGPGGAEIPASAVDLLRVAYVPVRLPTDAVGLAAAWPDPLPPLRTPLALDARVNQPIWVRVTAPHGIPAGAYTGSIRLTAQGWEAAVPLRVEVYGFDLPRRMTCETAFGFSPGRVWQYQGVHDPAQRRVVLAKYWENFSAHHISPYQWAPLDPFSISWEGLGAWRGGLRDPDVEGASGQSALRVQDDSETANISAHYTESAPIPPAGGLRLRFRYRTVVPGHRFMVSVNHLDADGNWMSGRNRDLSVEGDGTWQTFDQTIPAFPPGAASVRLSLWAAVYTVPGRTRGTVWFDDLSLSESASGRELVRDGGFETLDPTGLQPVFDWTAWDRAMSEAEERYGFNAFSLPVQGLGGGTFHARSDPQLLGYPEQSETYQHAFATYASALEQHLREKGWLDEAYVYWFDEPDPKDYAFVMNGFRKLKTHAPGLRRMLTEQVEEGLLGGPNLWCPVSSSYDHEAAETRRAEGEAFWWYVCTGPKAPYCTLFIDHPATELRVWLWQTWQRKIRGILVWQSNYWTSPTAYPEPGPLQNPYTDPMSWVSGYDTPVGARRPWGNGDGRFIYPPEAAADGQVSAPVLEGPVDSIRWELLRDGIEDYEYFVMLSRLLGEQGDRLPASERTRLQALLEVPAAVTTSATEFTLDPAPLEAHREALARAVEALTRETVPTEPQPPR